MRGFLVVASLLVIAAGCGSEDGADPSEPAGPDVYAQPFSDGNTLACATCHAMEEPAPDGFVRPGHPIGDAAARATFKNGQVSDLLTAVNSCRVEWMAAPAFAPDDSRWRELEAFLVAAAPTSAPALVFERVDPPANVAGGDAERGRAVFNNTCIVCHGEDGAGTQRAPRLAGLGLDTDYIARRVRTSGLIDSDVYDGLTGGRMPFWAADRLSDAELLDAIAFVATSEAPTAPDAGPVDDQPDAGPATGGCDATHPRVGQVAELSTLFHDVSGTATVVDDCTIRIDMFSFDGLGIDVRVYGAKGGAYEAGFSMSDDLRRSGGYSNESLTVTVPAGRTLDDLDGISIWCVPAGASFGDGLFGPA